jgi:hypothetical protein
LTAEVQNGKSESSRRYWQYPLACGITLILLYMFAALSSEPCPGTGPGVCLVYPLAQYAPYFLVPGAVFIIGALVLSARLEKSRIDYRSGTWIRLFSALAFVVLGVALMGLGFLAGSYQGDPIQCLIFSQFNCYSYPYVIYVLPLLSSGFLAALWGSAYALTINESRKR